MPLDFVAANDEYVEIGDVSPLGITSAITLSAWVNIASKTAEKKAVAKWSDSATLFSYLLTIGGAAFDQARFAVQTAGDGIVIVTGTTAMVTGTWHHLVGTYDGTILRIYVDGVEEATTTPGVGGAMLSTIAPVRVGAGSGAPVSGEEPMDGDIDDARIYDRVLPAAEVQTIHASEGHDGIVQNLAGRWLMNEAEPGAAAAGAGTVKDVSGNGNDGTPTNTPTYAAGVLNFRRKAS